MWLVWRCSLPWCTFAFLTELPCHPTPPNNDIMMQTELQKYTNQMNVAVTASNSLQRHHWYLTQDSVSFSLLDDWVLDKIKTVCVTRMKTEKAIKDHPRQAKIEDTLDIRLDVFFPKRSHRVFDVLKKGGVQKAKHGLLQTNHSVGRATSCTRTFRPNQKA